MSKKKIQEYGPNVRGFLNGGSEVNSTNAKNAKVPNNISDPIVVNNIAWQEFDYTADSQLTPSKTNSHTLPNKK